MMQSLLPTLLMVSGPKIPGNWGYGNSVTNGGTWEMARKK
jgi:hypothetical protein